MDTLLTLDIMVEPDIHRFHRFALEATIALAGNPYVATVALDRFGGSVRDAMGATHMAVAAALLLDQQRLYATCGEGQRTLLTPLAEAPLPAAVTRLTERLKQASESADSELLMRRNQKISEDLEQAKRRAAAEMAELEAALQKKKDELQASIRRAEIDSLTGLLNRGAYDARLEEAFRRCRRQNEPLCLLLLDLDKFKEINDTNGHQYGDEYLKRMATAITHAVRTDVDFPCRIGGDEFAIILFAELAIAKRVATNVLERMNQRVSIGIAQATAADTVTSLVARADAVLYEAKRQGRGRFVATADAA